MRVPAANLRETAAPPPGELIIGRYDEGADYLVRRSSGAHSWLLLWTEAGAGDVRQGGVDVRVGPGDLAVLAPRVHQTYRTAFGPQDQHWEFWWVHFQPRPAWQDWLRPFDLGDGCTMMRGVNAAVHPGITAALRQAHADTRWTA